MSHYTQDQIIADLKSAQAFEDKVFGDIGDTLFKEAAECIDQLRAQLEQVTKERDEYKEECIKQMQWIDIAKEKLDSARAQRDRAVELMHRYDSIRINTEAFVQYMRDVIALKSEIAKEKENK